MSQFLSLLFFIAVTRELLLRSFPHPPASGVWRKGTNFDTSGAVRNVLLVGKSRCFALTDLDLLCDLALTQFCGEKNVKCQSKRWRNRPTALSWYNEVKNCVFYIDISDFGCVFLPL